MKLPVLLLAIFVCVSLKIDAFPQQPLTVPDPNAIVPKVESIDPIKTVADQTGVQSANPVEQPIVPADQNKSPTTINTDALKQNNGETSSVASAPTAAIPNDVNIKPTEGDLPKVDNKGSNDLADELPLDVVPKAESGPQSIMDEFNPSTIDRSFDGDDSSLPCDSDDAINAKGSESNEYVNIRELIRAMRERIRSLLQHIRSGMRNDMRSEMFGENSESEEARNINFPTFSMYGSEELE